MNHSTTEIRSKSNDSHKSHNMSHLPGTLIYGPLALLMGVVCIYIYIRSGLTLLQPSAAPVYHGILVSITFAGPRLTLRILEIKNQQTIPYFLLFLVGGGLALAACCGHLWLWRLDAPLLTSAGGGGCLAFAECPLVAALPCSGATFLLFGSRFKYPWRGWAAHSIEMICGSQSFGIIQCKCSRTLTIECKD